MSYLNSEVAVGTLYISKFLQSIIFRNIFSSVEKASEMENYLKAMR